MNTTISEDRAIEELKANTQLKSYVLFVNASNI